MVSKGDIACLLLTFLVTIISIFLLAFSFDTLEPQDAAFLFNANTMHLETDELFGKEPGNGGRRFTGLGKEFKWTFPRHHQRMRFSAASGSGKGPVTCLTIEGAEVLVSLAFQYTLPMDETTLLALFHKFGTDWEPFVIRYSRSSVRDTMSLFQVTDLYENREAIKVAMQAALTTKLAEHDLVLENLQLLNMDIPRDLQDAIETTSVFFQGIQEAEFEQDAERVRSATDILTATEEARILAFTANATASATRLSANADAFATKAVIGAEAITLGTLKTELNLATADDVLTYLWIDTLQTTSAGKQILGLDPPSSTSGF